MPTADDTHEDPRPDTARLHVEPGGPSRVVDLGAAVLRKCSVSEMDNSCYLLSCAATGEQLLVDAAADADRLAALVAEGTGALQHVVTTHRHWDHHRALPDLTARYRPTTWAGASDADELPVAPDHRLEHGDRVRVGQLELEVLALRGHTPGSIALALRVPGQPVQLFTGDSLFPGGPGKTWSADDFGQLVDDLEDRLFARYPDDTVVHPGHGDGTTLGTERPQLPQWRARGW
ncbi:MBL fold metallo-hydrolase [Ornithinicoccus halotolerans]|uniref:MBL fold metallo-hydrolase n=1 Tax=Ornithinicoccus halotolerans TaxID=1748220 RepID=UPI001E3288DC|nr:MBL fold metallo-hydrolase [Ornithinicoccus halotolerans]